MGWSTGNTFFNDTTIMALHPQRLSIVITVVMGFSSPPPPPQSSLSSNILWEGNCYHYGVRFWSSLFSMITMSCIVHPLLKLSFVIYSGMELPPPPPQ